MSGTDSLRALLPKLAPIIARLATPHDGERLGCVAAIERVLAGERLDFNDFAAWLASPPVIASGAPRHSAKHGLRRCPVPDVILKRLMDVLADLGDFASEREMEIAESLLDQANRFGGLTEKQLDLAHAVIDRVRGRAGDGDQ